MSSLPIAAKRHRISLLAATVFLPVAFADISPARAQQSASPDLLPPVTVTVPTPPKAVQPAETKKPRRIARARVPKPKPAEAAAPAPGTPVGPTVPNVVSPTGIVTSSGQAPNSVTIITAQDIATQQYRTVPEALATVPGLNVVPVGGPGGQTSVFMRGTNSNHTKILIDGIDIGDPSTPNAAYDYGHLLVGDIEQIEVLRGPQSGLYGSDAIGGVISIITKKGDGPPRATASIETGAYGTFNQNLGLSGSQNNVNYAIGVDHLHISDLPVTPLQLLPPGQHAIGNNYDNMTYSAKTGADINEFWSVNSVMRYTDATLHFTGNSGFPGTPNAEQSTHEVKQFFTREEAVLSLLDGRIKNYFGINYANEWSSDIGPGDPMATVTTGTRLKYDWHAVTQLAAGQNLVVGAEQQTETIDTTGFSADNGNKATFVELQNQFADRFFLVTNFRNDFNDQFGEHATYRIAPSVIVPFTETKLKASYGTGFKAPSLSELFQSFPDFAFFSNPNLQPELSKGYDVGFEQPLFNDVIRFGSTYFHNDITNLIVGVPDLDPAVPPFAFTYGNIGQATTEGTENFALFNITNRFNIRADYTFTRAIDAGTGIQLLRRPKEKWSTTATWKPIDQLTLSATVLHVSSWLDVSRDGLETNIYAPGYTIVNLRCDYAVNDQIKLFGRIDNLFDLHYQNPTGYLAPGLGVFGGVRFASYDVK
ncbi:MAG: TonB-dependent receptor [Bradyrhizobium sp.]|nr:TonB-dependent receptor [Bradyrhizobium sp.]